MRDSKRTYFNIKCLRKALGKTNEVLRYFCKNYSFFLIFRKSNYELKDVIWYCAILMEKSMPNVNSFL